MPSPLTLLGTTLLLTILVTAHFSLAKQAEWNGTFTFDSIFAFSPKGRSLPNSKIPLNLPSTGLDKVDNYFAFMASFFYASLDARNVRAHWQGNHLLGTLSSIWFVMLGEVYGSGTGTGFVAWTYVAELMGEFLGIGLFTPVWCLVHLATVGTRSKRVAGGRGGTNFRALGYALVIGHAVPTVLMLRTEADGEGVWNQQLWMILRLFHPVFVGVLYQILRSILPSSGSSSASGKRHLLTFSILTSSFFHVSSLALLLSKDMFPGWLGKDVLSALDPYTVLVPVPFWSEAVVKKVDFPTGVAVFLQWDWICSSAAIVVWAATMYADTAGRKRSFGGLVETVGQAGVIGIMAGPGAAAAWLMQERDAVLDGEVVVVGEKKRL